MLLSVQKTVAAINLPISVVDLSGHLTYINPACAQFFMQCHDCFVVQLPDFTPDAVVGVAVAPLLNALGCQPGWRLTPSGRQEVILQLKAQQRLLVKENINHAQGELAGYLLQFCQLQPDWQTATKLQLQQYATIIAPLTTPMMLVDPQQTIVAANQACLQVLHQVNQEIIKFIPDFNCDKLIGYPALRFFQGLGVRADLIQSSLEAETTLVLAEQHWRCVFSSLPSEQAGQCSRLVQLQPEPRRDDAELILQQIATSLCLLQCDANGKIRFLNPALLQFIDATAEDWIGKDFTALWSNHAEQQSLLKKLLAELKKGRTESAELMLATSLQPEVWLAVDLYPLQAADGKVTGMACVAQDITTAKLQSVDQMGQMNAINLTQAVIEFSLDGSILTANQNFLQTLGYQLDEIKGRHHSMFVDEQYKRSAEYQSFWQRLRAGEFFIDEYKRFGKGGKEIWIQGSYNPIPDAQGKPFKVVKYAVDITNRKVVVNELKRVMTHLSQGDLSANIERPFAGEFAELGQVVSTFISTLRQIITDINEAAATIKMAATEISAGNIDLSSRTEQQAANLEQTASSMEELTSTVKQNSDNSRQANVLAGKASEIAVSGGQLIEQVVTTMASINDSAQKISDIIGVIDGIAFQTNILALNAAVEAARAGEQGRGFAVVASEVRTLAQRSANAAKDIKGLISDSVNKIRNGNELVDRSGSTMKDIVVSIKRVNDLMAEIAAASAEQATGIDEINKAVTQMDEMTQQNAALVEEAAAASESLLAQAEQLYEHVAILSVHPQVATPKAAAKAVASRPGSQHALQRPMAKKPVSRAVVKKNQAAAPVISPLPVEDDAEWESF